MSLPMEISPGECHGERKEGAERLGGVLVAAEDGDVAGVDLIGVTILLRDGEYGSRGRVKVKVMGFEKLTMP